MKKAYEQRPDEASSEAAVKAGPSTSRGGDGSKATIVFLPVFFSSLLLVVVLSFFLPPTISGERLFFPAQSSHVSAGITLGQARGENARFFHCFGQVRKAQK